MTTDLLLRGFCALLYGGIFSWIVFSRYDNDVGSETVNTDRQRYLPYLPGTLLPGFLIGLTILCIPYLGLRKTMENILPMCFGIFLHISVYYLVLILIFPLLRKHISSRACAMLWFLPNYLYLTQMSFASVSAPALVIHISSTMLWILLVIWLTGFLFVMVRAVWQHFSFRHLLLKNAIPISDPVVHRVWQDEIKAAKIKKAKYKLIYSKHITTPLSIGSSNRSIVVLPEQEYTEKELSLILRHELIHICRGDSSNKFFLLFCCAMCWFNPLMWYAMRKSADDLELSCDETVLIDSDEEERKQYANLILNTVGEKRGFTTCLSASASALKYRLKNIAKPAKKHSGAIMVGAAFFLMFMTSGYTALSYGDYSGYQIVYQTDSKQIDPDYKIAAINTTLFEHNGFVHTKDEDALEQYIGSLHLGNMPGNYTMDQYKKQILLIYQTPKSGSFALEFKDQILTVTPLNRDSQQKHYRILDEMNWVYLSELLYSRQLQSSDLPFPPRLLLNCGGGSFDQPGIVQEYYLDGVPQQKEAWWDGAPDIGLTDPDYTFVRLKFTHQIAGEYTIEVSDLNGDILTTYLSGELKEADGGRILPILNEDVRYTLRVPFEDSLSYMIMEYTFTVDYT